MPADTVQSPLTDQRNPQPMNTPRPNSFANHVENHGFLPMASPRTVTVGLGSTVKTGLLHWMKTNMQTRGYWPPAATAPTGTKTDVWAKQGVFA